MKWFTNGLIGAVLVCVAATAQADVFDDIESNIYNYWIRTDLNPSDPYEGPALENLENNIDTTFGLYHTDGHFTDISYANNMSGWLTHVGRLVNWTIAYLTPNNKHFHSTAISDAMPTTLAYINGYVGSANWTNWWHRDIGTPRNYVRLLILINKGNFPLPVGTKNTTMGILDSLVITDIDAMWDDAKTGGNGAWLSFNLLYYAVLKRDAGLLAYVDAKMKDVMSIKSASPLDAGIKPDYSFKQHGGCPMTGMYGAEGMGHYGGMYVSAVAGTAYALPDAKIQNLVDWLAEGLSWKIYNGFWDPAVRGRSITRYQGWWQSVWSAQPALAILANLPTNRQTELRQVFKTIMQTPFWSSRALGVHVAPDTSEIMTSGVSPQAPVGHRHYPWADHTVHRSGDWFASVKMYSNRVRSYEPYNNENKKSWHRSAGWLYVVLEGDEYFDHHVMPTLDWNHLPGTTVEQKSYSQGDGNLELGTRTFVGGAHADGHGVAAMDYDASGSNHVTAKKSWFFFDDEIVALGSDIDCSTANPTHTTVNQWPLLSGATAPFYIDGAQQLPNLGDSGTFSGASWAHAEGLGYFFPGGQTVKAARRNQSGKWSDIGEGHWPSGDDNTYTNTFLTLWFDHGTNASNQAYAYAVLPRKTKAETEAYAAGSPVTVLAHTNSIHAVKDNHLEAVGAVFWSSSGGSAGKVSADKDCLVYYRATTGSFTLALSDPRFHADTITVTVDEPLEPVDLPSGVSATVVGSTTEVVFRVDKGRSVVARFSRITECADNDLDGYGSPASGSCAHPQLDCDDNNPGVNPGEIETCNQVDDDCDGITDEGCLVGTSYCREAEEAALAGDMSIGSDAKASGGGYISAPSGGGTATFTFNVGEDGDYLLWGRVVATDTSHNSFLVSVDGSQEDVWHLLYEGGLGADWAWDAVSRQGAGGFDAPEEDPWILPLAAGAHTVVVRNRENGTRLDRLLLTNDLALHPDGLGQCSPEETCSDLDGDGYGDPPSSACPYPEFDCNDGDPGVNPGAVETCNQMDDDCDGSTDEGCDCTDGEERPCGTDVGACEPGLQTCAGGAWGDCAGGVGPRAEECNGIDDDCDGVLPADEADADGDGVSPCEGDCDDGDPAVSPQADEVCNGIDDDCDQTTDEGCPCDENDTRSCGIDIGACEPGTQRCQGGVWSECEGGVDPVDEVCGDDLDNDCDGQTDEGCGLTDPDLVISGGCGCGVSSPGISLGGVMLALAALAFLARRRRPRFGRYTLLRHLGQGSMGEVYLASMQLARGVEKRVVVKRINASLSRNPRLMGMFLDEARICVHLRHGNIVSVFDIGRVDDTYYLAMEFVEGVTLSRLLGACRLAGGTLPVGLGLFVSVELCKGLHHVHNLKDHRGRRLDVVHRDIGPRNVMISTDGEVKLLDFGVARAANRILRTQAGAIKGTLPYLSPEQALGSAVDARSDLFSLGVLLYRMVTGEFPYEMEDPSAFADRVKSAGPVPPSRHNPEVSSSLDDVIMKALSYQPCDRQRSAAELGSELTGEIHRLEPSFMPQTLALFVQRMCGRDGTADSPEPVHAAVSPSYLDRMERNWYITQISEVKP
jgi:hyaluronate lyase